MTTPNAEMQITYAFLDQLLRKPLMLPDDYKIVGATTDGPLLNLLLSSDSLPPVASGQKLHLVSLHYRRDAGTTSLQNVQVTPSNQRG